MKRSLKAIQHQLDLLTATKKPAALKKSQVTISARKHSLKVPMGASKNYRFKARGQK
jgi:hypothetical protein